MLSVCGGSMDGAPSGTQSAVSSPPVHHIRFSCRVERGLENLIPCRSISEGRSASIESDSRSACRARLNTPGERSVFPTREAALDGPDELIQSDRHDGERADQSKERRRVECFGEEFGEIADPG